MGKIYLLDETTINKIAAGEVIERPASIVKELVENSIDAGADAISIEIQQGGKALITVSDNGCGILKEDMEHVFFRHATSKIKSSGDIQGLHTLGFRGEAMASIAAVSEVELKTKAEDDSSGGLIIIKGGQLIESKDIGYPTGTSVTIRKLFFNTPARLKFLKSEISEQGAITDMVEKLALTNTGISVKLTVDNKTVLHTPGNGDLLSVILCIYGKNIAKSMLNLDHSNDIISIEGYIGKPEIARGNSTYMTFSINNRFIKSRMLAEAMKQAYKTLLMNNRYPFSIININIKSDMVDVNVHPSKQEVKFSDERAVFNTLYLAVKNCLNSNKLIFESFNDYSEPHETVSYGYRNTSPDALPMFEKNYTVSVNECNTNPSHFERKTKAPLKEQYSQEQNSNVPIDIIGQLFQTYILGRQGDTFLLIDQHAAHERIMYEHIKEKYNTKNIAVQGLVVPIVIELSPADKALYSENSHIFGNLGFEISWFGENSLAIRTIPIIMGEPCSGEFFSNILDSLKDTSGGAASPLEKIVLNMACKNAIKAGDIITPEETRELIEMLRKTSMPYTCPHGRPTMITMSKYELEKKFKRIV